MDAIRYRDDLRASAGRMRWRRAEGKKDEELVEVVLQGKAPWGFTLRGGTEHREPLIITKVEPGSVAAAVHLQAGDEMVSVNAVPLSGSRQQAICLVKGSHGTLTLVVRRAKMVDVVSSQTMPSETEVHVARTFLTKILRSSIRKNDPGLRPHSWHSSKLTEEESEPVGSEATPATVWQPKHDASCKDDSSSKGSQRAQQTNPLSPVNSMEKLECPSPPYPPKYITGADPLVGSGAKDSGFSCFSSSSSPPINHSSMSGRKGTSAENIFFKGLQSEGLQQSEWQRYPQSTLGNAGWEGSLVSEQPASLASVSGRPNVGPVWQLPEKKKSQSPPPPPLPLRNDSFSGTKVFPYSEGPSGSAKSLGRASETLVENSQNCRRFRHQNQLHPSKLFSLSSSDISQSHYTQMPAHQRQYSDESPFYLQNRIAPPSKTQSVGSYYRSLQDLPANAFSRKQVRHSTATTSGCSGNSNLERYYGPASKHSVQSTELKNRKSKSECWRGSHWMNSGESGLRSALNTNIKAMYSIAQTQSPFCEKNERNSGSFSGHAVPYHHLTYEGQSHGPENHLKGLPKGAVCPTHEGNDQRISLSRHKDPWVPQEDHRISALKTPLLHCLAQESRSLTQRRQTQQTSATSAPEASDNSTPGSAKSNRRSDRYATTLRKEIQQKRAQLQKSRSAATLTYEDEDADEWRSTEALASSSTYKDHLKEAQARVLQATSFQRRDLEPPGPDVSALKPSSGRIRGRRRFHPAKGTHSFSEPDKMDKVGVEGESQTSSDREGKFFGTNSTTFPRPVPKIVQAPSLTSESEETNKSTNEEPGEGQTPTDLGQLCPGLKQVSLDQSRLGTFAEYQASWNKQKRSADDKTQGRYHSAENILDAEEKSHICLHERSRSSPSADFHAQNVLYQWTKDQEELKNSTTREIPESSSPDHSPQPVPSVPRNEGNVPGLPDHSTQPDPASPAESTQPAQTQSLLPPPRPHLGPKTTSSSQEFHTEAQSGSAGLRLQTESTPESREHEAGRCSSPSADLLEPAGEKSEAAQSLGVTERLRSPSPHFAPLRLTDKPPAVPEQDDSQHSSETQEHVAAVMDVSGPAKKVPVRIVHAETSVDRQSHAYLPPSAEAPAAPDPSPLPSAPNPTDRPTCSLFSAYTRHAAPEQPQAPPAAQHLEDAKRDELARDIMGKDKSLVDVLDQSGRKTTMDLMEGLFTPEECTLEGAQQRRRPSAGARLPTSNRREEDDVPASASASLVPSSSYYNTSAPKAELLIKMKDMQEQLEEQDSEDELDVDLANKKHELISSLARKLEVLREARQSLQEDVEDNEALGREVEATVQRLCLPNQLDRFRMFVGDLDKVVSLLLSLSGRLARVENALNSLEDEAPPEEKRTLTEKRKLLMRQHDDAKELKENLDRRERLVSGVMEAHLGPESLDDYRHFVKMKSALIIEQRKLEDKIKLGEEQLKCLTESLPLEQRPPL